ncbi:hypothetical protein OS493_029062 [Desmophyllum pertusum]|uniref:Consortin N-terminal domain-containing protein n=1 Tax=Desmophyllum pertusum TaxID=174260 RepID=A0A9W9YNI9_9CNID|nr:hypothetical protein OS493_029062 [Desmophyllum pertusum]
MSESSVEDVVMTDDDKHSSQVDQNTGDGNEQTDLPLEEKLPGEPLTDQERHLLYEKGIKFKKKGNSQHALYCLLACVRGLKDGSKFQQLPECLHNIAEIYSQLGDCIFYLSPEKLLVRIQAEKLYYETSLINVGNEVQTRQDEPDITGSTSSSDKRTEKNESQPDVKEDPQGHSAEARSANEYEKLAHMCLKQKDAQLALEYCGKAVKLRQSIYGEEHPVTKRTLDLFTVIYAEMGKEQYTAAMQKFNESKQAGETVPEIPTKSTDNAESVNENSEENGQRSVDSRQSPTGESRQDERDTVTPSAQVDDEKISITPGQAMFCFFLITAAVAIGVTLFCCHVSGTDPVSTFKYIVTRLKYYYFYYFRRAPGETDISDMRETRSSVTLVPCVNIVTLFCCHVSSVIQNRYFGDMQETRSSVTMASQVYRVNNAGTVEKMRHGTCYRCQHDFL